MFVAASAAQGKAHEDRGGGVDPIGKGFVMKPPCIECGFGDPWPKAKKAGTFAGFLMPKLFRGREVDAARIESRLFGQSLSPAICSWTNTL